MVYHYSVCGNCNHYSADHKSDGKCKIRKCTCPGFTPKKS